MYVLWFQMYSWLIEGGLRSKANTVCQTQVVMEDVKQVDDLLTVTNFRRYNSVSTTITVKSYAYLVTAINILSKAWSWNEGIRYAYIFFAFNFSP